MERTRLVKWAVFALPLAAASASAQWVEVGEAPELPPGQITVGVGPLSTISGTLTAGALDVDMYCIFIFDPVGFGATTAPGLSGGVGFAAFDSQLWLFDMGGFGVTFDDDTPGFGLASSIGPAFPPAGPPIPGPGHYLIAISSYDRDALGPAGTEIWADGPFGAERPPDGPGAPGPVTGWAGVGGSGDYTIFLMGATFCEIPAPGSLALLGLGGMLAMRRRR